MKRLSVIVLFLAISLGARAQLAESLHLAAEWGFTATMFNYHHYNYMDEGIGFRIDDRGWSDDAGANAYAYLSAGFDVSSKFNLGLLCGYAGINDGVRVIPLEMKVFYYPWGSHSDGPFAFLQGGGGFKTGTADGMVLLGQGGGGYRLALDGRTSLDIKISLQLAYDHPKVWDPLENNYISDRNIRRNEASYYGLNIGLGLEF